MNNRYAFSIGLALILVACAVLGRDVSVPTLASAASCTGTWQYQESDISDLACVGGGNSACVPNPNNTNVYSAYATCPSANPDATPCTVGSPVLLQGVSGPRVYGNHCKWNSVEGNSNLVQTSLYACADSSGAVVPASCGIPATVTANLVANPTSVTPPEKSLLTWSSSTNATSCTGTNFSTGGATSGSVFVSPAATTPYAVSCTDGTSSAKSNASVSVDGSAFSVSCTVNPSTVSVGQPALWSSTVTGGTGSYTYSWSGTDGLAGFSSSVSKIYDSIGQKYARLTVSYTPGSGGADSYDFAAGECSPHGNLVAQSNDTEDGVAFGPGFTGGDCSDITPPGGCCSAEVREVIGPSNRPVNTYYFYKAYDSGSIAPKDGYTRTGPGVNTTNFNFFAMKVADAPTGANTQTITADCSGVACTNGTCTCTGPDCGGVHVTSTQCSDGIDNDGDGRIDFPQDTGCSSLQDDDETNGGGQCADGLDNDTDGKIDCSDSGCHTDGNAANASSCNPGAVENPQCSDSSDNDGDGKVDIADPGCHTDSDASNAASYNPGKDSEVNTQCSDGIDNDGNGKIDYKADGSGDVGCSSLADDNESSNAELTLALAANATIVQYNSPANLVWSATNVQPGSCKIAGTNGSDYTYNSGTLGGISGQVTTANNPLRSQATFTLSCKNLAGQTVTTTAIVHVTPRSGEF